MPNYITKSAHEKLVTELTQLKNVKRKEIQKALAHARSFGDLSENAEYDAAKHAMNLNEAKISDLEQQLAASQVVEDLHREYDDMFRSLGVGFWSKISALLWDARLALLTVALAGFGRAMAEVGAVLIVGGNIHHVTRVMTTTIALETSKGNLELALALGVVLLALALLINAAVMSVRSTAQRAAYA